VEQLTNDYEKSTTWLDNFTNYLNVTPYADLLTRAKKSHTTVENSEEHTRFYDLAREYCFELFVDIEGYSKQICSYEWNLRGLKIQQSREKISVEDWDDLFSGVEILSKENIDSQTFDRLKR